MDAFAAKQNGASFCVARDKNEVDLSLHQFPENYV